MRGKVDFAELDTRKRGKSVFSPKYAAFLTEWYFKNVKYPLAKKGSYFSENKSPEYVYVFFNDATKNCKIGKTTSPKRRLKELETGCGHPLTIALYIELHSEYDEDPFLVENLLHTFFLKKRIFKEWFRLDIRDLLAIRKLFYEIEGEDVVDNIIEVARYFKK